MVAQPKPLSMRLRSMNERWRGDKNEPECIAREFITIKLCRESWICIMFRPMRSGGKAAR
jgi:hypothetical protein